MNLVNNALSDRQMAALRVRADFKGPASGPLRRGMKAASEWLTTTLADASYSREVLRRTLANRVGEQTRYVGISEYGDGWATVLEDVALILAYDVKTIQTFADNPYYTPTEA